MLSAQTFENVNATFQGNKVLITYDLIAAQQDQPYAVEIFGSHNNYTAPINVFTGDAGNNVKPGANKKVEWDVLAELKTFKGEITFELRGKPVILKLNFKSPVTGGSVRRGKTSSVQWLGGTPDQQVKLELYKNGQFVSVLSDRPNSGDFDWAVPKEMEKGEGFTLKLTSGQESVSSGAFAIKSKIPLALKIAPVVLVGAAIAIFFDTEPPPPPPGGQDLPEAPDPD